VAEAALRNPKVAGSPIPMPASANRPAMCAPCFPRVRRRPASWGPAGAVLVS
jgi:hypothetical protein